MKQQGPHPRALLGPTSISPPGLPWGGKQASRRHPWRDAKMPLGIAGNANVRVGAASIAKTLGREKRVKVFSG
jgi:hypothetical protein